MKISNKKNDLLFIILAIVLFALMSIMLVLPTSEKSVIYVSKPQINQVDPSDICKEYTDSINLYGGNSSNSGSVENYESYIDTRYNFNAEYKTLPTIYDEQILRIVPLKLFEEKIVNFLYIGMTYGFYFDYNAQDNNYLIYLMLHNDNNDTSTGQYTREIVPLYYERYKFDSIAKKVSLDSMSRKVVGVVRHSYDKYSDTQDLYIRDVSFSGALFNENNYNIGESGYDHRVDNGGFFIGNNYQFKGISTKSGYTNFDSTTFKMGLANVSIDPISIGDAMNIDTLVEALKLDTDLVNDFRGSIENETKYGLGLENIIADKYTQLIKVAGAVMETDNTKKAVLFGINNNSYVKNTFYYNYRNHLDSWNTRFAGKISMDIVGDNGKIIGSTVTNIATNIQSNNYCRSFDNGEKTVLLEDGTEPAYILAESKHPFKFVAPSNGIYTFETSGSFENQILSSKGDITTIDNGVNQRLLITLKKDEIFTFSAIITNPKGSHIINMSAEFTPNRIEIGETKEITIAGGEREYFYYFAEQRGAFDYKVSEKFSESSVDAWLCYGHKNNIKKSSVSGTLSSESYLGTIGKYLIVVYNPNATAKIVSVSLSNVEEIGPNQTISTTITDEKVFEYTSSFSSYMRFRYVTTNPISIGVYDSNHNSVAWNTDYSKKYVNCNIEAGEKYYIELKNNSSSGTNFNFYTDITSLAIDLGENAQSKKHNKFLYKFYTPEDISIEYNISSTGVNLTVYDDQLDIIPATNGKRLLTADSIYYVMAESNLTSYNINISPVFTESTTGTFSEMGVALIKFTPTTTAVYEVSGVSNYSWYNDILQPQHPRLNSGGTYYLKIQGTPNTNYSVSIQFNRDLLPLNGAQIYEGEYYFNITQAGYYNIYTFCVNNASSNLKLYDIDGLILNDNINADVQPYERYYNVGTYLLDVDVSPYYTRVGLHILASTQDTYT